MGAGDRSWWEEVENERLGGLGVAGKKRRGKGWG
jgi:hypothetical protein